MIDTYTAESSILRAEKVASIHGEEVAKDKIDMTRLYLSGVADKTNVHGKEAIKAKIVSKPLQGTHIITQDLNPL